MQSNLSLQIEQAKKFGYSAFLLLESGEIFFGYSVGSRSLSAGELCFTTGMSGYQHSITDPSFAEQIIVFTHPHIGNVGINNLDSESSKIFCKGIVLRENIIQSQHHLSKIDFSKWLINNNIVGICGIDTRRLTKVLNSGNAQNAVICTEENLNVEKALDVLSNCPSMLNRELSETTSGFNFNTSNNGKKIVALVDFGVKHGIIENLNKYCTVKIIQARANFHKEILSLKPDGIIFSNGPGDPNATYELFKEELKLLLNSNVPILGICLGHQLLALSMNLHTEKMHVGHRGNNHPVYNLNAQKVEITSQNHGFVVSRKNNIPDDIEITHISLFDNSIEGFKKGNKIFSYQHHPEGSPGPNDSAYIFKDFFDAINCQ